MVTQRETCIGCDELINKKHLNHRDVCEDCAEKVFCEECSHGIKKKKEGRYECEYCDDKTYFHKC